jgi:glycosyltransferase involved in cell wall biosynthesis
MPAPRLSAFIITHNEAHHLPACLAALQHVADEVIVLDDGSTDDTVEIARQAGARVQHRVFDGFGKQKQAALELTSGEWILSVDADEQVTPELAREILATIQRSDAADGYWIRRELLYLGKKLRFGGTGSDWVVRLARRHAARFELLPVHEHILIEGRTERLRGTLTHIKYESLREHVAQINVYTEMVAEAKRARGARFHGWHLLRIPFEIWMRLIIRGGFLDGRAGVIWAGMAGYYAFVKYAKLWRASDG